jgi:hypothetical protein
VCWRAAKVAFAIPMAAAWAVSGGEVAAADVADVVLGVAVPAARGDRADSGVGAIGVDRQHQPIGQHLDRQRAAPGNGGDLGQATGAQDRLLEDVDQRDRSPSALHLGLDAAQIPRLRRRLVLRQRDRT